MNLFIIWNSNPLQKKVYYHHLLQMKNYVKKCWELEVGKFIPMIHVPVGVD